MSGDTVLLTDTPAGRIAELVGVLRRFPATPRWVLVGGLAVNVRLARSHRVTNDVDTVSGDQPKLVEILASPDDAVRLSAAKVELGEPSVEVDVMESTEGAALPPEPGERAFALARRWAMRTASAVSLGVVDANGAITAEADLAVASVPALIALKTVSIPRALAGEQVEGSAVPDTAVADDPVCFLHGLHLHQRRGDLGGEVFVVPAAGFRAGEGTTPTAGRSEVTSARADEAERVTAVADHPTRWSATRRTTPKTTPTHVLLPQAIPSSTLSPSMRAGRSARCRGNPIFRSSEKATVATLL